MTTAVICTAILAAIIFLAGFLVSITRGSTKTNFGYAQDPADNLYKRVRAHGNAAEFNPILAVLYLYLGASGPATWVVWVIMLVTAARVLHPIALITGSSLDNFNIVRALSSAVTYFGGLALVVAALLTL